MTRNTGLPIPTKRQLTLLGSILGAAVLVYGCSQVAGLRPPAGAPKVEQGLLELQAGRTDRARADFNAAVKQAGSDYRTAASIAGACGALKQWDLTAQYGELALKQTPAADKPTRRALYGALSEAYLGLGQPDKAVQIARQGFSEEPDEPAAMNLLGYTYADVPVKEKLPEALDLAQKAVKISTSEGRPEDETAMYLDSVGWAHYQMGNIDDAIPALTRASYELPRQPDVLYHLGMAYMKKERYADAIAVLERAVKLSPNEKPAEQALKEAVDKLPPKPAEAGQDSSTSGISDPSAATTKPGAARLPAPHP